MNNFLAGAAWAGSLGASLFFLRFWRETGDRFFAIFALAFLVLSVNWFTMTWLAPAPESRHIFYLVRLVAFVLIIAAIVDKNRSRR